MNKIIHFLLCLLTTIKKQKPNKRKLGHPSQNKILNPYIHLKALRDLFAQHRSDLSAFTITLANSTSTLVLSLLASNTQSTELLQVFLFAHLEYQTPDSTELTTSSPITSLFRCIFLVRLFCLFCF